MTQNYDTSIEYDVSITNLKIMTAFLAAILIFWLSYLDLKDCIRSFRLLTPIAQQMTQNYDTRIEYDVSITNLKIMTAFLTAILIFWLSYLDLKDCIRSFRLLTPVA